MMAGGSASTGVRGWAAAPVRKFDERGEVVTVLVLVVLLLLVVVVVRGLSGVGAVSGRSSLQTNSCGFG